MADELREILSKLTIDYIEIDCPDCNGRGWYSHRISDMEAEQRQCLQCYGSRKQTMPTIVDIDQAISAIKSLFMSKIKHIDKEAWNKANSLNPDSVEYLNAYEKANTLSQALTEIEKIVEEL